MNKEIQLRGMTWDHSRGYDPMIATSEAYSLDHPNVSITWEKRSLQEFADKPIGEMSSRYDLMVIDHPHVGEVSRGGHLLPLEGKGHDQALAELATNSVGLSHSSYEFEGHQWALAIDAATPVSAFRKDRLESAPKKWAEVLDLARSGEVAFALIPINALMTFFGMAKNLDYAIAEESEELIEREHGLHVLGVMREIFALMDPRCLKMDPIAIYEWLGRTADAPSYSPFGYGYTNYSREGYCKYPLIFADAPGFNDNGPRGTVLGGTGIAISAECKHPETAIDYAYRLAGSQWQRGIFFSAGGQPAHSAAWEDPDCNEKTMNFFRNTRQTLETSWLRPRYEGYMYLQNCGGDIVQRCLKGELNESETIKLLNVAYQESQQ